MPRGSVFGEDASRPYYCCYALGCEIFDKTKTKVRIFTEQPWSAGSHHMNISMSVAVCAAWQLRLLLFVSSYCRKRCALCMCAVQ